MPPANKQARFAGPKAPLPGGNDCPSNQASQGQTHTTNGRSSQKKGQNKPRQNAPRARNNRHRGQRNQQAKGMLGQRPTPTVTSHTALNVNREGGGIDPTPNLQQLNGRTTNDTPATLTQQAETSKRVGKKAGTVVNKSKKIGGLYAAQKLGGDWITAAGYDGPLLPQPALTTMVPSDSYNMSGWEQGHILTLLSVAENTSPQTFTKDDGNYDIYLQQNAKQSGESITNTPVPSLRRIVRDWPESSSTQDENPARIPTMEVLLGRTIGSLPPLSQRYLAYHIASSNIRDSSMMLRYGSYVTHIQDQMGSPSEHTWTPRSVHKNRFTNRGHSNGYKSFAELVQADMASPSLSHFSIMKMKPTSAVTSRYVGRNDFNVFQNMVKRPELVMILAKHLRVQELLILYSISKPFHQIVSARITTVILSQALMRAPDSARIFPFRCYARLCIHDPGLRPHPVAEKAAAGELRSVPSFRWLHMVCYREMVCHEILTIMAEDGVPVPPQCEAVLKKIWFMMDIPDNVRRIGLAQNTEIFTDNDLFFATLLFVKLDMRFTDPLTGSGKDGMRRLLMAQPGLTMLWKTLKRTALVSKLDVVKLYVRWKYHPGEWNTGENLLGIPHNELGIMQYQGWGRVGSRIELQRPDELLLKESLRRRLNLQDKYTDMFLWGYVNPRTLENFPPEIQRRPLERLEGMEEILVSPHERHGNFMMKAISHRVLPG